MPDFDLKMLPTGWRSHAEQTIEIWNQGGWAMWPLAAIAIIMLATTLQVAWCFLFDGLRRVPEKRWRAWMRNPERARGRLGEAIAFCATVKNPNEISEAFARLLAAEIAPLQRDLRILKICASAAPLVGLLGTVTGMYFTFKGLSSGGGGSQTMANIAAGISEALITTESGLVIAIPGLFLHHFLRRKTDKYRSYVANVESVLLQNVRRLARTRATERTRELAQSLALAALSRR